MGIPMIDDSQVERIHQFAESLDTVNLEESLERLDFVSELLSEIIGVCNNIFYDYFLKY